MEYRDSCTSKHSVANLLRWSTGSQARYGQDYVEYVTPQAPAKSRRTAFDKVMNLGKRLRDFRRRALDAFRR